MRVRLLAAATLAPLAITLVSLALASVALADPCPTPSGGGC